MKTYILTVEYAMENADRKKVDLRSFRTRIRAKNIVVAHEIAGGEAFAEALPSEEIHGIKLELV